MTVNDMMPGIEYLVTKSSTDGMFRKGNRLMIDSRHTITILPKGKAIDRNEWIHSDSMDFSVEIWYDPSLLKSIENGNGCQVSLDDTILRNYQAAMAMATSSARGLLMGKAAECYWTAKWLEEYRDLKQKLEILGRER